jgi:hypothetical protein
MASQLDPNNVERLETYYGLGLAYIKSGDAEKAIEKVTMPILLLDDDDSRTRKLMETGAKKGISTE